VKSSIKLKGGGILNAEERGPAVKRWAAEGTPGKKQICVLLISINQLGVTFREKGTITKGIDLLRSLMGLDEKSNFTGRAQSGALVRTRHDEGGGTPPNYSERLRKVSGKEEGIRASLTSTNSGSSVPSRATRGWKAIFVLV